MLLFSKKIPLGSLWRRAPAESKTAQFGRDARSDWQQLCFAFLFLNACMIGVSIFVYAKINKGELFLVDKQATVSFRAFDMFKLNQTLSYFNEKKERFAGLKEKGVPTADPYISDLSIPKR